MSFLFRPSFNRVEFYGMILAVALISDGFRGWALVTIALVLGASAGARSSLGEGA